MPTPADPQVLLFMFRGSVQCCRSIATDQIERTVWIQSVRTFYTSSSRAQAGAGPDNGRTANSPAPYGLTAPGTGLYLWAAGYVPVGRVGDWSESSPLATDRLGVTERRQPRCAPDPAGW
jgi:hypothetical protein